MMNIVIIGAGSIGQHLAALLSKEQHNVIIVDHDKKKIEQVASTLDVATRVGSGSNWQLLDEILELRPDLLIALTNDDDTNLVSCSLAKQLGYPSTIARVHDNRFLNRTRLDFGRIFDVDYFICPELLAANDIMKFIDNQQSLHVEYFAHGAVQLRTIVVPEDWGKSDIRINRLDLPTGIMIGLIARYNHKSKNMSVIFPHGDDWLAPGDEVTFIGETDAIEGLTKYFAIKSAPIRTVVIIGGSTTGYHLAKLLEKKEISTKLIEKNYDRALFLADHLPNTTIVHHDALDIEFLRAEKIQQADLFVACTRYDDINLLGSEMAQEVGCKDVLIMLSNSANLPILKRLGIAHTVSPVISATNRILSQIFTGSVNTLVSFYDNQAEVLEINVSIESKLVGIPLSELGPLLPRDFLIAVIQNRGRIMVAHGNRILSPGDTVIVISNPQHISEIERIF